MEDIIKDITLDYLKSTPEGETVQRISGMIERLWNSGSEIIGATDNCETGVRAATAVMLSMLKKYSEGKRPRDYGTEDWADVADTVKDLAVNMDGQIYSEFVFVLYASAFEGMAKLFRDNPAVTVPEKIAAIENIAKYIRKESDLLKKGTIDEVSYTEECLWKCIDGVVKILAVYTSIIAGKDKAELAESVSMLAVEYGRLMLYRKEQELLSACLEEQYSADSELKDKFNKYIAELRGYSDGFLSLIDEAFDPDMNFRYEASIKLAIASGVDEKDILDTEEKIDDYFLI